MKRKVFCLIGFVLLLCGCDATYNVNISNDTISDELIINNKKDIVFSGGSNYKEIIDVYSNLEIVSDESNMNDYTSATKVDGYSYYNKIILDNNGDYGLKFSNSFLEDDYKKTPLLIYYGNKSIKNVGDKLYINSNTSKGCTLFDNYPYLDNLTLNVTISYNVVSHNADKVSNNIYTWYLNRSNYKNKEISVEIDKSENASVSSTFLNENQSNVLIVFLYVFLAVAIFVFGFYTYYKVKNSNN